MKGQLLKSSLLLAGIASLSACQVSVDSGDKAQKTAERKVEATPAHETPSLRFMDVPATTRETPQPILHAQVILDRLGFSPGVIDGKTGQSFTLALKGFQQARDIPRTGELDDATGKALEKWRDLPATRFVTIPDAFARQPFFPQLPKDAAEQAKLPALGYRDLMEALSERFHTTPETLKALNTPNMKVGAGTTLRVPNIADIDTRTLGEDTRGWNHTLEILAVSPVQPKAEKIVVDKSDGVLRVFDAQDKLIAQFPATMGSRHDPLPIGTWKIQGVSRNPDFHYNPKLFWDVSDAKQPVLLKPGPNGPVGIVWIDISKPHYGIHGTNEPQTIGRAESHGCVRLTNWDAARLAEMVKPGLVATFQK
jgi:lipoprotein-anchoring transpeptidase ErfK/SrfK